jgi:hypothetical protein
VTKSHVATEIKIELDLAKAYAEGRGIRIKIKGEEIINDIRELIDIKLANCSTATHELTEKHEIKLHRKRNNN